MHPGYRQLTVDKYVSSLPLLCQGFEVFPNDIIVSCAGTIGETYVLPTGMRKGIINQALMKISLYDLGIIDFYLMYFDFQLKSAAQEQGHGIALKNIPPFDVLKRYLVPIPPIQEQQRIIATVNDLLSKVDSIDADSEAISNLIAQAKSKILDLAIRGQLVPQDPEDEPASVLLERIREEKEELIRQGKIKRDKKESVIFKGEDNSYYEKKGNKIENIDDEIPFELPDGWMWCRGQSCFEGMDSTKPQGEFFDYIDIDAIDNRLHRIKAAKHLPVSEAPSRASRVSELIQIKIEHVELGYFDLYTKGGKLRRLYIPKRLRTETLEWLEETNRSSGYLFLNRYGERITTRGISQQLKNYAHKYGLDKKVVYPHSFRHRYAKNFLEKYNDIALLADLMGHESIETTRIYLRRTASEQQALVDKIVTW